MGYTIYGIDLGSDNYIGWRHTRLEILSRGLAGGDEPIGVEGENCPKIKGAIPDTGRYEGRGGMVGTNEGPWIELSGCRQ